MICAKTWNPGFTSKLRRDIEQAIDRREEAKPRIKPYLIFVGIGALATAVLFYPWGTIQTKGNAVSAVETPVPTEAQAFIANWLGSTSRGTGRRADESLEGAGQGAPRRGLS